MTVDMFSTLENTTRLVDEGNPDEAYRVMKLAVSEDSEGFARIFLAHWLRHVENEDEQVQGKFAEIVLLLKEDFPELATEGDTDADVPLNQAMPLWLAPLEKKVPTPPPVPASEVVFVSGSPFSAPEVVEPAPAPAPPYTPISDEVIEPDTSQGEEEGVEPEEQQEPVTSDLTDEQDSGQADEAVEMVEGEPENIEGESQEEEVQQEDQSQEITNQEEESQEDLDDSDVESDGDEDTAFSEAAVTDVAEQEVGDAEREEEPEHHEVVDTQPVDNPPVSVEKPKKRVQKPAKPVEKSPSSAEVEPLTLTFYEWQMAAIHKAATKENTDEGALLARILQTRKLDPLLWSRYRAGKTASPVHRITVSVPHKTKMRLEKEKDAEGIRTTTRYVRKFLFGSRAEKA